jgi:hypothetical protein
MHGHPNIKDSTINNRMIIARITTSTIKEYVIYIVNQNIIHITILMRNTIKHKIDIMVINV